MPSEDLREGTTKGESIFGSATPGIPDPPLPFTGGRIPASDEERRSVERRVMAQFFVAPALSFAALGGGFSLGWPRLAGAGSVGLGLTAIITGWLMIREQRLMFIRGDTVTPRAYRYFIYEGFAAIPYGLAWLVAGVSLTVASVLFLSGVGVDQLRDAVLARPHRALLPIGACLLCYGLGFMIGFRRPAGTLGDRVTLTLLHLPAQLGGLILVALGIAMLGLGVHEWLNPDTLGGVASAVARWLSRS